MRLGIPRGGVQDPGREAQDPESEVQDPDREAQDPEGEAQDPEGRGSGSRGVRLRKARAVGRRSLLVKIEARKRQEGPGASEPRP